MIGTANEGKGQIKWNEMEFYLASPECSVPYSKVLQTRGKTK